jgi:hypothetical protein
MTGEHSVGSAAATGGLAVAIMLLLAAGMPAGADELSDLRANQQQLQLRLDQLSQPPEQGAAPAPPAGGPAAPEPSPLIGGSFPRSFVIPGTDTSVTIGGSVQENFRYGNEH